MTKFLTYEEIKNKYLNYEEGIMLVEEARRRCDSKEKKEQTLKVANALISYLNNMGFDPSLKSNMFFAEALIISAFIRDLYYDGTFISLFKARHELEEWALDNKCDPTITEAVFSAIESSMGIDTPNKKLIPMPDQPTGMLVIAIWVAENYL